MLSIRLMEFAPATAPHTSHISDLLIMEGPCRPRMSRWFFIPRLLSRRPRSAPWPQEHLDGAMRGRRRESHREEAKSAHDEAAAERELERAFRLLGLKEESVAGLNRSAPVKVVLAWWLRRRTTVSLRWVSDRLCMGHYTRVTQAISRAERQPGRRLTQMKCKLVRLGNAEAG